MWRGFRGAEGTIRAMGGVCELRLEISTDTGSALAEAGEGTVGSGEGRPGKQPGSGPAHSLPLVRAAPCQLWEPGDLAKAVTRNPGVTCSAWSWGLGTVVALQFVGLQFSDSLSRDPDRLAENQGFTA